MRVWAIFLQIFMPILLGVTFAVGGWYGIRFLENHNEEVVRQHQMELLETLVAFYSADGEDPHSDVATFIRHLPTSIGYRLTITDSEGRVLGDSHTQVFDMNSPHLHAEISQAIEKGRGYSLRIADEQMMRMYTAFYDASSKHIFRISRDFDVFQVNHMFLTVMVFALVNMIILVLLGFAFTKNFKNILESARWVVEHYARGDFSKVLTLSGLQKAEEFSRSVNRMGMQLRDTILTIERRQEELQSMLEGMTASVVLLDNTLKIRELNPAAATLVGQNASECRGRNLLSVFRSPELYDLGRAVADTGTSGNSLIRLDRESGTVYLQTHATLIHAGCLLVMNDVTQITRLEMMRTEFVANVSHELRTPITSILGFVETMQNSTGLDSEKRKVFLNIVHRQVERLVYIIEDLTTLSQLEQENTVVSPNPVRVRELFDAVVAVLRSHAESKDIQIHIIDPQTLEIWGFPVLVEQALVNLLDNAIKFSPAGSTVEISSKEGQEQIILSVYDYGPGIPEEELERIFERFYRVDKARSRDAGGTGLGLAIVKHIALKHGGRAWAESRLGEGCAFHMSFPITGRFRED